MDRGAILAEGHDIILRNLPQTTGKPLQHWLEELESAGAASKGFLDILELLRDKKGLPHAEANAITWAYMNQNLCRGSRESCTGSCKPR